MSSTDNAPLQVAVLAEIDPRETRVAMTPDDVRKLTKRVAVTVERGAGSRAGLTDVAYQAAGAALADRTEVLRASILAMVRPLADVTQVARGTTLISLGGPDPDVAERMRSRGLHHLGLERVPRISRAQSIDVLTSQATVAGYAAVLEGARRLCVMLPMTATAAGNIPPAHQPRSQIDEGALCRADGKHPRPRTPPTHHRSQGRHPVPGDRRAPPARSLPAPARRRRTPGCRDSRALPHHPRSREVRRQR